MIKLHMVMINSCEGMDVVYANAIEWEDSTIQYREDIKDETFFEMLKEHEGETVNVLMEDELDRLFTLTQVELDIKFMQLTPIY